MNIARVNGEPESKKTQWKGSKNLVLGNIPLKLGILPELVSTVFY